MVSGSAQRAPRRFASGPVRLDADARCWSRGVGRTRRQMSGPVGRTRTRSRLLQSGRRVPQPDPRGARATTRGMGPQRTERALTSDVVASLRETTFVRRSPASLVRVAVSRDVGLEAVRHGGPAARPAWCVGCAARNRDAGWRASGRGHHGCLAVASRAPWSTVECRGSPGQLVIGAEGVDMMPTPTALTAATSKVYFLCVRRPLTVPVRTLALTFRGVCAMYPRYGTIS